MASNSGFFKGEKKKKKRADGNKMITMAPVFTAPSIMKKGKDKAY